MAITKGMEKWKEKKWFDVYPPALLGTNVIGEMPADDDNRMMGRIIKSSMSWITSKMEHSFMIVGLKVISVNGNSAQTELQYLEQTYSYLHSLVKRHSSAIYTVDKLKDSSGKPIVLKLLVITRNKITTTKRKAIRKKISELSKEIVSKKEGSEIVKDIIEGNFQKECIKNVNNIADIFKLEIKKIEIV
jgi:ribosomal protein S3AE